MKKSRDPVPRTLPGEIFPWTPSEVRPDGRASVGVQGEIPPAGVLGAEPLDS